MTSASRSIASCDVLLDADLPDTAALFDAVGRLWDGRYGAVAPQIVAGLTAREQLGSTGLGQGVAIPHARCSGIIEPLVTFIRPRTAIAFDAPDGRPVACVVVLLVPENAVERHLGLLAEVAKTLSSAEARADFGRARTADDIGRLFSASTALRFESGLPPEAQMEQGSSAIAARVPSPPIQPFPTQPVTQT